MADINHVVLVGRLTRNAELKYTNSGSAVCKFAVAVNQYLVKGKQVGIEGQLRQDRWEQEGQSRSKVEIVASNVMLLGGGSGSGGGGSRPSGAAPAEGKGSAGSPEGGAPPSDDFQDDIPF
jgi:single-strand DNA-binding protein